MKALSNLFICLAAVVALGLAQTPKPTITNKRPYTFPPPSPGIEMSQVSPHGDFIYFLTSPQSVRLEGANASTFLAPPTLQRYALADWTLNALLTFENSIFPTFTHMEIDSTETFLYLINEGNLIQISIATDDMFVEATFNSTTANNPLGYKGISTCAVVYTNDGTKDVEYIYVGGSNSTGSYIVFVLDPVGLALVPTSPVYDLPGRVESLIFSQSQLAVVFLAFNNPVHQKNAYLGTVNASFIVQGDTPVSQFLIPNYGGQLTNYLYFLEIVWDKFALVSLYSNGFVSFVCDFQGKTCFNSTWGDVFALYTPNGPLVFENGDVAWPLDQYNPTAWKAQSISSYYSLVAPFIIPTGSTTSITIAVIQAPPSMMTAHDVITFDIPLTNGQLSDKPIANLREAFAFQKGMNGESAMASNQDGSQLFIAAEGVIAALDITTTMPAVMFEDVLPGAPLDITAFGSYVVVLCTNTSFLGEQYGNVLQVFDISLKKLARSIPLENSFSPSAISMNADILVVVGSSAAGPAIQTYGVEPNWSPRTATFPGLKHQISFSSVLASTEEAIFVGSVTGGYVTLFAPNLVYINHAQLPAGNYSQAIFKIYLSMYSDSLYVITNNEMVRINPATMTVSSTPTPTNGYVAACYDSQNDVIVGVVLVLHTYNVILTKGSNMGLIGEGPITGLPAPYGLANFEGTLITSCAIATSSLVVNTFTNYIGFLELGNLPPPSGTTTHHAFTTQGAASTTDYTTGTGGGITVTGGSTSSTSHHPHHSTGAVVGGVIGGFLGGILIVGAIAYYFIRIKRRQQYDVINAGL